MLTKRWGRDPKCWVIYSTVLGMAFGSWGSWWLNRPWLEFLTLSATYELEAHEIKLFGEYQVNRECKAEPAGAVWRNEALATDGQIARYGPIPEPPPMFKGEHRLAMEIPLEERILPDGWKVTAEAYCPGESPETVVSQVARVVVLDLEESPP